MPRLEIRSFSAVEETEVVRAFRNIP